MMMKSCYPCSSSSSSSSSSSGISGIRNGGSHSICSLLHPNPTAPTSLRCAVLGAGFAGLSLAYHLLHKSPGELKMEVDIYDEFGIGGGASAVAGGLLHPYSPKLKPLWNAHRFWEECLHLLNVAQQSSTSTFISTRGILRPALNPNHLDAMLANAKDCLPTCPIHHVSTKDLIPNMSTPFDTAFFMPQALNINPNNYLQALFLACHHIVDSNSSSKDIRLQRRFVPSLHQLDDEYDVVVVCLGARANMLPELSGVLPLRTCRGVVAHLQLSDVLSGDFPDDSPSVLSDAWMAIKGPRSLYLGSTWEWGSRDYSPHVSSEEATRAMEALLLKASGIYPEITRWSLKGARGGLRAMPSRTPQGSFPLLGCIDDVIGCHRRPFGCRYWIIGGLGSRGLLYHALLGKLTAQAVLSGDEGVIPPELTSWKKMKTTEHDKQRLTSDEEGERGVQQLIGGVD